MQALLAPLLPVMLPVLLCAMLGALWARFRQPFDQEFVRRIVTWVSAPALIVGTFSDMTMPATEMRSALVASVVLLLFGGSFAALFCLLTRQSLQSFLVPLTFGNFGNMGLPLCLFAFGEAGLALGLAVFLVTTLCHFSLGVAILNGRAAGRALLQSPILYSGVAAASMLMLDWSLPPFLQNTADILGSMCIPLMLLTLGISLSSLRVSSAGLSLLYAVARLGLGLLAGLTTVWVLELEGVLRQVVLLQSAMPAAVFNYLLAVQYRREADTVAGIVVMSTLLSFVTIPALLLYLGVE